VTPENSRGDLAPGFSRFWWGEAVPGFGSVVTVLALQTLVVVTLQGSAVQVGWLNSARWLPYRVFGLVVGALVDRTRRRRLMMAIDLIRGALLALIPLSWALDLLTFPLLLVLVILFGTISLINDAASVWHRRPVVALLDIARPDINQLTKQLHAVLIGMVEVQPQRAAITSGGITYLRHRQRRRARQRDKPCLHGNILTATSNDVAQSALPTCIRV
jgi:MFS family permease